MRFVTHVCVYLAPPERPVSLRTFPCPRLNIPTLQERWSLGQRLGWIQLCVLSYSTLSAAWRHSPLSHCKVPPRRFHNKHHSKRAA